MKPSEIEEARRLLISARKRIDRIEKWFGLDHPFAAGESTGRLCAILALDEAAQKPLLTVLRSDAYAVLRDAMGGHSVAWYNNTHTHTEVLKAFDRAIQSLTEPI